MRENAAKLLLESILSLPVALILSSLLQHQIPFLKSCCHANVRLQSTQGWLECWRQSCFFFFTPTSPPCLCGGGALRVRVTPWNALMCYNLLHYLWKQTRASLRAGRLPFQPCRVVSSSLFLHIWLVWVRLPFRRSRPIITLSRWHLCGWCAALRGSPINIRYTYTHTLKLWHTFQFTWNTFAAVCSMSDVMLDVSYLCSDSERWEQLGKRWQRSFFCKENLADGRRWVSFISVACRRTSAVIWLHCTANDMTFEWLTDPVYQPWCWQAFALRVIVHILEPENGSVFHSEVTLTVCHIRKTYIENNSLRFLMVFVLFFTVRQKWD